MNRSTALAVEAYRKAIKAQWRAEAAERELTRAMASPEVDLTAYHEATEQIDRAIADVDEHADAYAESTLKQMRHRAVNAGRTR